jgi:sensor histidine kinase YesM
MANTIGWSFAVMLGSIVFFREFFRTKTLFVKYDAVLKGLMFCICLGWLFEMLQQHVVANMYAHTLSNIGSLFMMFVAVCAYRKDFRQAKLFILGWIFMIVSLIVSFFRHVGIMDNNIITTNSTFIAVVLQSLLLSVALVQMIKILTIEKQKALEQSIAALENAQQQEMAYLHAQIKPHFLYNALNVIISLCRIDASKAGDLLLDLSVFLRHSFDFNKEQKLVYLKDELEYVKAYVHIEQARFRNKLDIVYELKEDTLLKIPSLVLQPLVENAIVHGIRNKEGTGKIVLRVIEEKEQYRVEVQDDGVGMTEDQIHQILSQQWYKGKGVGITNINQRLFKIFGQGLVIKSILGQGTSISFCVPKEVDRC